MGSPVVLSVGGMKWCAFALSRAGRGAGRRVRRRREVNKSRRRSGTQLTVVPPGSRPRLCLLSAACHSMKGCGTKVVNALEGVSGVASVDMDFPARSVRVAGSADLEVVPVAAHALPAG